MIKYNYKNISTKDLKKIIELDNENFSEFEVYTPNLDEFKEFINKFPKSICIIKDDSKLIGYCGIFPTNKKIMTDFLKNKISEKTLFKETLKKININNFDSVYLGFIFLYKEYRKKSIGINCLTKQIKYFLNIKDNIQFFSWGLTKKGLELKNKLEKQENIKIFNKK